MPRGTYKPNVVVDTTNLTEEEWLDYRRGGIGGSDVSIIFGVSHFRTCRELYYDKLGIEPMLEEENSGWLQKKWGMCLKSLLPRYLLEEQAWNTLRLRRCSLTLIIHLCVQTLTDLLENAAGRNEFWNARRAITR